MALKKPQIYNKVEPMASMKSENKLEGTTNFRAQKIRFDLILASEYLLEIVQGKIIEPIDEVGKKKYNKYDLTAMSIIVDFIKDHLIPYISKLDTSKKMYDALIGLYTIKNIEQVMTLRNEFRDFRMTKNNTIASYFVRISQLREHLQAIEEIVFDKEIVISTLNRLPQSWDSFASCISS